jgi:hypothetical protein
MNPLNRSKTSVYGLLLGASWLFSGGAAHATEIFTNIIDPLNPTFTQALGINNAGTIAGYGNATAFNGFTLTLPSSFKRENFPNPTPPPSNFFTQVVGIDAAGDTVGFYVDTAGLNHGFTDIGGTFTTVDRPGTSFNQLLGINQKGTEIAGYSSTDSTGATLQEAFSLASGTYTDINALLVAKFGPNDNSQATGVNNGGWVVGFYQPTTSTFNGFVDEAGVISSISAPFAGTTSTQALGVNDLGWIVGDYTNATGTFGFLDRGGVFTTIDPFGSTAVTANGINDLGRIVGFYTAAVATDQSTIGFEAKSIPEASTWAMVLLGFGGLGFFGYRKVRQGPLAV